MHINYILDDINPLICNLFYKKFEKQLIIDYFIKIKFLTKQDVYKH